MHLQDPLNRKFEKLRVSLTSDCNLSCSYCVPGVPFSLDKRHETTFNTRVKNTSKEVLNWKQLGDIILKLHKNLNFKELKLTGGEPLLYPHIIPLIAFLNKHQVPNISLTTNAVFLGKFIDRLHKVNIKKLNISLDAVDAEIFQKITGKNQLSMVLSSIDKAVQKGFEVKLNAVIMKGVNHSQVIPLVNYAKERGIKVRFLELMKMGYLNQSNHQLFYSAEEILNQIAKEYIVRPVKREKASTANYWQIGDRYEFGIIANESLPFCSDCNRLRIDQYGEIYGCLSKNSGDSIIDAIDNPLLLESKLQAAMWQKQTTKFIGSTLSMMQIGG